MLDKEPRPVVHCVFKVPAQTAREIIDPLSRGDKSQLIPEPVISLQYPLSEFVVGAEIGMSRVVDERVSGVLDAGNFPDDQSTHSALLAGFPPSVYEAAAACQFASPIAEIRSDMRASSGLPVPIGRSPKGAARIEGDADRIAWAMISQSI